MSKHGFRILEVEVEHFRGYASKLVYNFPRESTVFLFSGPNGYGKTSFFDSIEWVLTGEISRISENIEVKKDSKNPTEQSVINNISNKRNENFAKVTLKFLLDNLEYEIKRESQTYKKDYLKENTKLFLKTNGVYKEINEQWIDSLFIEEGLNSYRLSQKFSSYHLCSHEKNLKILQKNRESLHSMLSILFGENKLSLYRDNAKELINGVSLKVKKKEEEYSLLIDSTKESLINKSLGSFEDSVKKYNSWLLPNELGITVENVLYENLYEKQKLLSEVINVIEQKGKYLNFKRYLKYKSKEKEYQFFLSGIESLYIETKAIIEDKNFSIDNIESERKEIVYFENIIKKLSEDLNKGRNEITGELVRMLKDFSVKFNYDFKYIKFDAILDYYEISSTIKKLKQNLDVEEKQKKNFEEQNIFFINFLSYAKKHIEANHQYDNCPLCNQEIPLEKLKEIIKKNQDSFSQFDINLANLKDELKDLEKETTFLRNNYKKELETILDFTSSKIKLLSHKLQQKPKIEQLEKNLESHHISLVEINETLINSIKEKYHIEIKEALELVNQKEVVTESLGHINDYIAKYDNNLKKYKDIVEEIDLEKLKVKLNSLENIIENNNYLSSKGKIDKVANELKELKEKQKLIKSIRNNINTAVNQIESTYKNELEAPINYVYRKINRHSNFSKINISLPSGAINKKVDTTVGNEEDMVNLSNVLSSGQITTVALSFFLGIAFKMQFSKFNAFFFDDPIQQMDDLNILSFIDLIRVHLNDKDFASQIFFSTCNEDMDNLLVSKMTHFNIGISKFSFKNYGEFEKVTYSV
jgi:DNA repair protein SbcC/Rad50